MKTMVTKLSEIRTTKNFPVHNAKICIINDSPIICEGIFATIEHVTHVDQIITTSKKNYFKKHSKQYFDIIITEIEFKEGIDREFIKEIKSKYPATKIIVTSLLENYRYREIILKYGANYFIFLRDIPFILQLMLKIIIGKNRNSLQKNFQIN